MSANQRAVRIDIAQLLTETDVAHDPTRRVGFETVQSLWAVNDGSHAIRIEVVGIGEDGKPRYEGMTVITLAELLHIRKLRTLSRKQ